MRIVNNFWHTHLINIMKRVNYFWHIYFIKNNENSELFFIEKEWYHDFHNNEHGTKFSIITSMMQDIGHSKQRKSKLERHSISKRKFVRIFLKR